MGREWTNSIQHWPLSHLFHHDPCLSIAFPCHDAVILSWLYACHTPSRGGLLMRLLVMLPPNPNICTKITGTPVSACVSHVLHTNLSHPGIPIYRAFMSHTAEPLAVRPITTSLRVLVLRRRRGRRTRPTGTSVQIKLAPPPLQPPCPCCSASELLQDIASAPAAQCRGCCGRGSHHPHQQPMADAFLQRLCQLGHGSETACQTSSPRHGGLTG